MAELYTPGWEQNHEQLERPRLWRDKLALRKRKAVVEKGRTNSDLIESNLLMGAIFE
jgi:hypothetical protein